MIPVGVYIEAASRLFMVDREDILGPSRVRYLVRVRFAIAYLARREGHSSLHIGRVMSRDHSAVLHACDRADYMKTRDHGFEGMVSALSDMATALVRQRQGAVKRALEIAA